ncbi:methyltransferase domain-containing protein [Tardiphaga alba]|uniref:Methyltransferase domain-containing protein n=2 Tax=Tardiphaga alba TaxID=340268 RepID=A0ABX8A4X7_9BRAD|nr:methyltransferase domain-containing protein [Tardiphaga alba]
MLDLGCGTGLAGPHLVAWGGDLSGVDLSTQMLARAEQRGVYDALVHAEALDHLRAHSAAFDLIFAADTLIYFGRLDAAMAVIAQAVMHGGIFAASIECAAQDFAILPSGRFAHADDYLLRLAEPYFELLEQCPVDIRLEANMPVKGTLFVWRRR